MNHVSHGAMNESCYIDESADESSHHLDDSIHESEMNRFINTFDRGFISYQRI